MPTSNEPAVRATPGCSASRLESELLEILQEPISSVKERERTELDRLLAGTNNRCVLFGAGSLGRSASDALKNIGIQPLAMSDNNRTLRGTTVDGTPLLSPVEAAERFGKDALFIITIRNEFHWYRKTLEQLSSLGCRHIASSLSLSWRFPKTFLPFLLYDLPHKLYEQADQVLLAAQLWEDGASRAEYLANIRLRALGDPSELSEPAEEESYFLDGVFDAEEGDTLVDCGAFDGDTIRSLIAREPCLGAIDAVEADSNSFAKLDAFVKTLAPGIRDKIRLHKCAVGAEQGEVRFENDGTVDSKISVTGGTVVEMMRIDDLCASAPVSMIKMDIEGGEFDALLGAKQVIQRDRPILAICAYHLQEDIWRLPLLIRRLCPEYRMYLKAYRGDAIQTVVYAVPPERVRGARKS